MTVHQPVEYLNFLYLRNGDKLQLQRASPALYLASHIPSRFLGK